MSKVPLDSVTLSRLADGEGQVSRADFVKLGQDTRLLEFGGPMGEKRKTSRKERSGEEGEGGGGGGERVRW